MNNEKLDTTLNLSLEADENQRLKSDILSNGYDEKTRTWEVIVKYHGESSALIEESETADILLNGYAIIRATKEQLERLVILDTVEFMELPKGLQYAVYRAKQESCILPVVSGITALSGKGVLIAVIDSGIDYLLSDFRDENGSRILYLWDQTLEGDISNAGQFSIGTEFTKEEIDRAIAAADMGNRRMDYSKAREWVPSVDVSGHGTAVTGIAAGSSVSPLYQGVAPQSSLIIVKLRGQRQNAPLTTDLMRGITYVIRKALDLGMPIAINLSIGDTYGAHDGTSLLEQYIDSVSGNGRNVICIGAGNEAVANGHTSFVPYVQERIELSVAAGERSTNVQIWKNYVDTCEIQLVAPNGERFVLDMQKIGMQEWRMGNTQVLIYISPPKPYSVNEEVFFDFIADEEYIDSGIWSFIITPVSSSQHDYHMFLPGTAVRNSATRFLEPTPELTMTIPAFARSALTVGAYNTATGGYADFSGRDRVMGEENRLFFATKSKPDIVAPGVEIVAPSVRGGYESFSGTSFATPLVTGSAALLMEWGIVRGNDLFLYGEKVKAYLRKGARPLKGDMSYPNPKTGWGALCLAESFIYQ